MKIVIGVIWITIMLLFMPFAAVAGSIPEDLLTSDSAQVFFGEVVYYHPDKENPDIEVSPLTVVKGDVPIGGKLTYYNPSAVGDFTIKEGNVYLFTYFDEHNPTEIFEVTSYNTATLKLKHVEGDMWKRFEVYLNEGQYEEAELRRIGKENDLEKLKNAEVLADLFVLDREKIEKIAVIYPGEGDPAGCYLDKEKFFNLAEGIRLSPNSSDASGGQEQNAGVLIMPQEADGDLYHVWISQEGKVGSQLSISSEREPEYEMSRADYLKLYAFLPGKATTHMLPDNPMKYPVALMVGVATLLFVLVFLAGFLIYEKRK